MKRHRAPIWLLKAVALLALVLDAAQLAVGRPGGDTPSPDQAVLRVVLDHLTRYSADDLPLSLARDVPRTVFFSSATPGHTSDACPFSSGVDELIAALPKAHREWALQAIQQVTSREVVGPHTFAYRSNSERVVVLRGGSVDAGGQIHPEYLAAYPISAWLPGYSAGHEIAVVKLWIPELFHPSYAIYVLGANGNSWEVLGVRFISLA